MVRLYGQLSSVLLAATTLPRYTRAQQIASNDPCSVCGPNKHVTLNTVLAGDIVPAGLQQNLLSSLNVTVPIPGLSVDLTCENLEFAGQIGLLPTAVCSATALLLDGLPSNPFTPDCGCMENPVCSVCSGDREVSNENALLNIPTQIDRTCGEYEDLGEDGGLTPTQCTLIQPLATVFCGCQNEDGGGNSCFSGASTVEVQGQGPIRMDDLRVGDAIRVGHGGYERVYGFGHRDEAATATFVHLKTNKNTVMMAGRDADAGLELTHDHMLYVYQVSEQQGSKTYSKTRLIPAGHVKVGDRLMQDHSVGHDAADTVVVKISQVRRRGVYAPFTATGDIVVDGVVASNYAAALDSPTNKAGTSTTIPWSWQHWMAHAVNAPHRLWYRLHSSSSREIDTGGTGGYSSWVVPFLKLADWIRLQHAFVQTSVVGLCTPLLFAVYGLETFVLLYLDYSTWCILSGLLAGAMFWVTRQKLDCSMKFQKLCRKNN